MKASDFEPHTRGDGRRFHVRAFNHHWQVYGLGLQHVCLCETADAAEMIAEALEVKADFEEAYNTPLETEP